MNPQDLELLRSQAEIYGSLAATLSLGIPIALFLLVSLLWKPKDRHEYARKIALYPAILFTYSWGAPIARKIFGLSFGMRFDQALEGWFILSFIGACIAYPAALKVWDSAEKARLEKTPEELRKARIKRAIWVSVFIGVFWLWLTGSQQ